MSDTVAVPLKCMSPRLNLNRVHHFENIFVFISCKFSVHEGRYQMEIENSFVVYSFVFILAFGEEILKSTLVFISKGTHFIIPAMLFLPIVEAILYYPEMYQHSLELGIQESLALPYTLFVIAGAKLFHISTSILYYYSRHIYTYVIFGTTIHFIHNALVDFLPILSSLNYAVFPWITSLFYAMIMYIFHVFMRRHFP